MRRKRRIFQYSNTQGYPLREHIDLHHPLVELADMIDWGAIDGVATEPFQPGRGPGRPILRPRLIAGLLYLQHAFNLSDEQVVAGWLENPYWQVVAGVQIWKSGQRRGVTRSLKAMIKRRSAIEPTIGHMKTDGRLGRNWLKGALGDAMHAVLCGAGHNIRLIINKLKSCDPQAAIY